MEIERKFLVTTPPENYGSFPLHEIEQAYLCTEPVVRIRKEDDNYYLTYKSKGLLAREVHVDVEGKRDGDCVPYKDEGLKGSLPGSGHSRRGGR